MWQKLTAILKNRHMQAFMRPFSSTKQTAVSPENKIAKAYICDWDNSVSENNLVINSDITVSLKERESADEAKYNTTPSI